MNMPDGNTAALNQHEEMERDAVRDVEAYMGKALDDLVWRVMENEEGRPFDLVDFLAEQKDLAEIVSMTFHANTENPIANWFWRIESRLRSRLEDSDEVAERAAEMAKEE